MSDFLARMATESRRRVEAASAREPADTLRARVAEMPAPPPLPPGSEFDIIAEVKRRSPSEGSLSARADFRVADQATTYAAAGAAAISVLTEPAAFSGRLPDLADVTAAVPRPVLRKDFLVDPYQLLEARVHGASGALLIVRLLDDDTLAKMIDTAAACGLFLLLEAFDHRDLERAAPHAERARTHRCAVLVGVNCRDLRTLGVEPSRFADLADALPHDIPAVAESGLYSKLDVARVAGMGYRYALIGTALMRSDDPGRDLRHMLRAARREATRS